MKFRPCIDLHNGKVKQIVGGTLTKSSNQLVENYVSDKDAQYYANLYKEDNLKGGHVIMLGPDNQEQALSALTAYPGGLQIGGGINLENASFYLEKGASHVIVTSFVFKDGKINFENLEKIKNEVSKEKLVIDLSCREKDNKYFVVTNKWQKFTEYEITESNLKELANYCDEFLVHAADVEGKCQGVQQDIITKLASWSTIAITYAGGARTIEDLELVKKIGNNKIDITIGSALDIFGGKLAYRDVVAWFQNN